LCRADGLRDVGVAPALLDVLCHALDGDAARPTELSSAVDAWLAEQGHDFHREPFQLRGWLFSEAGRRACERWGAEL
jgi:hypothetical protein